MDGRIGGTPPMGCHCDVQRHVAMARRSRDRVTIDLCGIGDAARAAAQARGATLAIFARQALIAALPADAAALLPRAEPRRDAGGTVKLSVRLSPDDSADLATQAAVLGLSQARLVALLIRRAELPRPVDRARRRSRRAARLDRPARHARRPTCSSSCGCCVAAHRRASSATAERHRKPWTPTFAPTSTCASAFLADSR